MGNDKKCIRIWRRSPKERKHSEDQGVDGTIESESIFGRLDGGGLSGFTYLRIGAGGGLL
jgi:hypothetical protein